MQTTQPHFLFFTFFSFLFNMGNYISCTLLNKARTHSKGTKVILPNGEIRQFDSPVNAAELMFETPHYFLVNAKSLHIGRRFLALNADEDLELCNVYAMFPMKRLNSIVTAGDMGILLVTANSAAKRPPSGLGDARVTPETVELLPEFPKIDVIEVQDFSVVELKHRLSVSMSRSRRPVLETIIEEPVYKRFASSGDTQYRRHKMQTERYRGPY
ncbi:hypothetical protein IFM89_014925 [Coptis chinensis]|uniref:Uncharacterized protein n=1 Tax=Coptis chinensis TaxID=261450 RepID=A0A835LF60_9MAGN|nr:hypothetical protein IFM89_014925 [Coptis chinensis]